MTRTIVVKLGGSTLGGQTPTGAPDPTLNDLVRLAQEGHRLVVVHGGGNAINGLLRKLGHEPRFLNGLRVTDPPALEAALMVLRGQINAGLVAAFNEATGRAGPLAVGLSGLDGRLLEARRDTAHGDIGLVGEIIAVKPDVIEGLLAAGFVVLVAPFAHDTDTPGGGIYNINADNAAAHLAAALRADACVFLTNVPGVLDGQKRTIARLNPVTTGQLVQEGVIYGGMIPKIEAALKALEGAERVIIVDGREPNSLYAAALGRENLAGTVFTNG